MGLHNICIIDWEFYLPANEEEAEKGNCRTHIPRLASRKLHRRIPEFVSAVRVRPDCPPVGSISAARSLWWTASSVRWEAVPATPATQS